MDVGSEKLRRRHTSKGKHMNREQIIRMAREAAFSEPAHPFITWGASDEQLERFAALVAAHELEWQIAEREREACAKVCDVLAVHPEYASDITKVAAQAIRARSEK
jgi:hypothetical protein